MSSELPYPNSIEQLIELLKTLPGIGKRGAERQVLSMMKWDDDKLKFMGKLLSELPEKVGYCPQCGAFSEFNELCTICQRVDRTDSVICVVETTSQIYAIEKSGIFKGRYHVLGGKLSPLDNKNGEDLNIDSLLKKVENLEVKEIILALGADVEARATAIYLSDILKRDNLKISCLAQGLPAGANLAYADGATISAAISGRTEI